MLITTTDGPCGQRDRAGAGAIKPLEESPVPRCLVVGELMAEALIFSTYKIAQVNAPLIL